MTVVLIVCSTVCVKLLHRQTSISLMLRHLSSFLSFNMLLALPALETANSQQWVHDYTLQNSFALQYTTWCFYQLVFCCCMPTSNSKSTWGVNAAYTTSLMWLARLIMCYMSGSSSMENCMCNAHVTVYDVTKWSWVNLVTPPLVVNSPIMYTTPTRNIPEPPELGTSRCKGQNVGSQPCPL